MKISPLRRGSTSTTARTVGLALVTAGVLAIAGCSGPAQTAATQTPGAPQAPASVAPIAVSLTTASTTPPVAPDAGQTSITAQGVGTVTGTPNVVTIVLGVQTSAASAQSALDDNNTRAASVIAVLRKNGVAKADLQTNQLSINPNFDTKGQITGYQVSNMVTAKLRNIGTAGAVIDAVGKAAGNAVRVQQLTFSIDNDTDLMATARTDAVKQAQAKAKQMADAAGVHLGRIRSITDNPTYDSPVTYGYATSAGAAKSAVPIEAGSQALSVVVQLVYEIAQ
jgi:uncharacterized protein YggE